MEGNFSDGRVRISGPRRKAKKLWGCRGSRVVLETRVMDSKIHQLGDDGMEATTKKATVKSKRMDPLIPDKLYFRIGEVAELCDLPTYVLRFWETEFPQLKPGKSTTGQRMYRRRDVDNVLRIRGLLYDNGFTIAGARQQLRAEAKAAGSKTQSPLPFPQRQSGELKRVRQGLREILGILAPRQAARY
jgi:DNA-binding transcriptional MerR regulator